EIARQKDKIDRGLAELERRLDGRHAFNGSPMQLGDIAVAVALGYLDLRFPELDWRRRHPGLVPFAERMFARDSLRDTQPPAG
ncbi:MAG: glutathione S-transferase C-terminal domain-containing protein, partial [Thauera sp.]|nr:glutathione S-transferase C-terminal domain-containing protein [Thauera sp.]